MSATLKERVKDTMPKPKRNDVPVKVDEGVIDIARIVAAYRKQHLAEYLSETLRPIVEKHLAEAQRERARREKSE